MLECPEMTTLSDIHLWVEHSKCGVGTSNWENHGGWALLRPSFGFVHHTGGKCCPHWRIGKSTESWCSHEENSFKSCFMPARGFWSWGLIHNMARSKVVIFGSSSYLPIGGWWRKASFAWGLWTRVCVCVCVCGGDKGSWEGGVATSHDSCDAFWNQAGTYARVLKFSVFY